MENQSLGIINWGTYLPSSHLVKDLVAAKGGDSKHYLTFGWEKISVAEGDDYPTSMCSKALKSALEKSKINPSELKLVICTSTSHDYLEVVTANEVMRDINADPMCFGFDLYQGCITTLTALEIARDWLAGRGGGYAAIVSGERRVDSIDKTDNKIEPLWCYGDGSSALVVGVNVPQKPKLEYLGSCFYTTNEMSGFIRRDFGGARSYNVPQGELSTKRSLLPIPLMKQMQIFNVGYSKVFSEFKTKFNVKPEWMVCNQGAPAVVEHLAFMTRINKDNISVSGQHYGHIGNCDLIIGFEDLEKKKLLNGKGIALSCNVNTWGAGLFQSSS